MNNYKSVDIGTVTTSQILDAQITDIDPTISDSDAMNLIKSKVIENVKKRLIADAVKFQGQLQAIFGSNANLLVFARKFLKTPNAKRVFYEMNEQRYIAEEIRRLLENASL